MDTLRTAAKLLGSVRAVYVRRVRLSAENGRISEEPVQSPHKTLYDMNGRQLEREVFKYDGSVHSKSIFVYDPGGVLLEVVKIDPHGSLVSRIVHMRDLESGGVERRAYNSHGTLLEKNLQTTEKISNHEVTASYNAEGHLILRGVHLLDDQGRVIKISIFKGAPSKASAQPPGEGVNEKRTVEESERITVPAVHRDEVAAGEIKYVYHETGNAEEELVYKDDGSLAVRRVTTFDEARNPVEITDYDADGNLTDKQTYTREFDSRGNWTKQTKLKASPNTQLLEPVEVIHREIAYY